MNAAAMNAAEEEPCCGCFLLVYGCIEACCYCIIRIFNPRRYWSSKVTEGTSLQFAPKFIRDDKTIVMAAINIDMLALEYASPRLRNNEEVMLAAVNRFNHHAIKYATSELRNDKMFMTIVVRKNGFAIQYAIKDIRNDKEVVEWAVRTDGNALQFVSPELQNDKHVVMTAIQNSSNGKALDFASSELQNDKEVVITALERNGVALEFASPQLRNNKKIVMAAIQKDGAALEFASPQLRNNKQIAMVALTQDPNSFKYLSQQLQYDKDLVFLYMQRNPDNIKSVPENLKRDPDVLVAAGMLDERKRKPTRFLNKLFFRKARKIVLSTRFSLNAESESEATNFTKLLKEHMHKGTFKLYAPNAFDKRTCDPNWTDIEHPCRGTSDTCDYDNVLTKKGRPTDDCCWRYSFRYQLEKAKATGGFMLQLVERDHGSTDRPRLGKGQEIEQEMAQTINLKIFHVYRPTDVKYMKYRHVSRHFEDRHIDQVLNEIQRWYDGDCQDMSLCVVRPKKCKKTII